ncbi:hypothetical protein K0T92_05715 [Paenibacillus oenotherae]|uniref:Spore germination protein PD n=1 Tax=Paenibacillus oenotherae TaxID=1435645 RepID=A0ABS7D307_9BACL|nr:hypothetical protein [Paenibacillus oenotherae]
MQFNLVNYGLQVGCIQMTAIASASMLQVGDSEQITLYSMFDTPPESVIVGPLVPLGIPEGEGESEVEAQTD